MTNNTRLQQLESRHRTTHQVIPNDFVQFNNLIGNPKHPVTYEPMQLMKYQTDFFNMIEKSDSHKHIINKSRQSGWTELILRILAYHSFHKYKGGKIIIIAGTRERTTRKILRRFKDLFVNVPHLVRNNKDPLVMELTNGTVIEGLAANPEAITGDTKIRAIFMDEAAKWNLIDDLPVLNAIMPIVDTNESDLFMISTPKGPRGFFYEINEGENDFIKTCSSIWDAVYNKDKTTGIYSSEDASNMLKDPSIDSPQEFENKFTSSRNAIFPSDFMESDDFEGIEL